MDEILAQIVGVEVGRLAVAVKDHEGDPVGAFRVVREAIEAMSEDERKVALAASLILLGGYLIVFGQDGYKLAAAHGTR